MQSNKIYIYIYILQVSCLKMFPITILFEVNKILNSTFLLMILLINIHLIISNIFFHIISILELKSSYLVFLIFFINCLLKLIIVILLVLNLKKVNWLKTSHITYHKYSAYFCLNLNIQFIFIQLEMHKLLINWLIAHHLNLSEFLFLDKKKYRLINLNLNLDHLSKDFH